MLSIITCHLYHFPLDCDTNNLVIYITEFILTRILYTGQIYVLLVVLCEFP